MAICGPRRHTGTRADPWSCVRRAFSRRLGRVFGARHPSTGHADAVTGPRIAYTGRCSSKAAAVVRTWPPGREWRPRAALRSGGLCAELMGFRSGALASGPTRPEEASVTPADNADAVETVSLEADRSAQRERRRGDGRTTRRRSASSRVSRPSASARACTSARPASAACTTWSPRSSTTRSTRRWPATATWSSSPCSPTVACGSSTTAAASRPAPTPRASRR